MKAPKTALEQTTAYFYNEKHDCYFGVSSYQLKNDGSYDCGSPTGVYNKAKMDSAEIPYVGILKEKK
jgi:hypothetical protein